MARRSRRSRDSEALGAILGRSRAFAPYLENTTSPIRARDWERAVGTRIAARTRPAKLDRGVLLVLTASAAWSNELSLLAGPIVEQLRALGVDVKEIRFRVGPIEQTNSLTPRRPAKLVPVQVPLDAAIRRSLAAVPDDDLRAAIEAAAKRSLGFGPRR
ncbi:MAG: DUF721 domain-containing protein [Polyangiaceae bacterium]